MCQGIAMLRYPQVVPVPKKKNKSSDWDGIDLLIVSLTYSFKEY